MTAWHWLRHPSGGDTPVRIVGTDTDKRGVFHMVTTRDGGLMKVRPSDLAPVEPTPIARNTDPDTSHAAAKNTNTEADRALVLLTHADNPDGLTDFELAALHERLPTSLGRRRGELRDCGLVEDAGERRPTPSGATAIVWRITEQGRIEAAQLRKEPA